jgi:hypothetical protein
MRERGRDSLNSVTSRELACYVADIPKEAMRTKMTSALTSFFDYLAVQNHIDKDPGRHLSRFVGELLEERATLKQLRVNGMSDEIAHDLRWRHIMQAIADRSPTTIRLANEAIDIGDDVSHRLTIRLIQQMQRATPENLDTILDFPVFQIKA